MNVGDLVVILIGAYAGSIARIEKIEWGAGAVNGWFTVNCQGTNLLYAGEEIRPIKDTP